MSYKLLKPYTEKECADFIVTYSHKLGLKIEKTENAIYALEKDEVMSNGIPKKDPEYESKIREERRIQFEKDFFKTSLGWIRRKVNMQNGLVKDFLGDMLMVIKAGLDLGQEIKIIIYKLPDFSQIQTAEYMETLQEIKFADTNFVKECLNQVAEDFGISKGGRDGI